MDYLSFSDERSHLFCEMKLNLRKKYKSIVLLSTFLVIFVTKSSQK